MLRILLSLGPYCMSPGPWYKSWCRRLHKECPKSGTTNFGGLCVGLVAEPHLGRASSLRFLRAFVERHVGWFVQFVRKSTAREKSGRERKKVGVPKG